MKKNSIDIEHSCLDSGVKHRNDGRWSGSRCDEIDGRWSGSRCAEIDGRWR